MEKNEEKAGAVAALLPCPFCGGPASIVKNSFPSRNPWRHPSCDNYDCPGHVEEQDEQGGTNVDCKTDEEAAELWNERTTPPPAGRGDGMVDELALIEAVLNGYPDSIAKSDALRAVLRIVALTAASDSGEGKGVDDVVWRIDNEADQFVDEKGMIYLRYLRDLLTGKKAALTRHPGSLEERLSQHTTLTRQPVAGRGVDGLPAKWRQIADSGSAVTTDYSAGARWAYAIAAAELEAALAATLTDGEAASA